MKITRVNVELSRKKTIDYQSTGNSVGLTADLEDGDDPVAVVRGLQREAAGLLLKMDNKKKDRAEPQAAEQDHQVS